MIAVELSTSYPHLRTIWYDVYAPEICGGRDGDQDVTPTRLPPAP